MYKQSALVYVVVCVVEDYNPFTGEVLLDSDNKLDNQKHAINDFVSCNLCDGCSPTDENCLPSIPSQTASTMHIGDSLDAAHVSWKWYSEGWTEVNQDTSGAESRIGFVFHHQPLCVTFRASCMQPVFRPADIADVMCVSRWLYV